MLTPSCQVDLVMDVCHLILVPKSDKLSLDAQKARNPIVTYLSIRVDMFIEELSNSHLETSMVLFTSELKELRIINVSDHSRL